MTMPADRAVEEAALRSLEVNEFHDFSADEIRSACTIVPRVQRAQPRYFDVDRALEVVEASLPGPRGAPQWNYSHWTLGWLGAPGLLSREEASFWFWAATARSRLIIQRSPQAFENELRAWSPNETKTENDIRRRFQAFMREANEVAGNGGQVPFVAQLMAELVGTRAAAQTLWETLGARRALKLWVDYLGPIVDDEEGRKDHIEFCHWAESAMRSIEFVSLDHCFPCISTLRRSLHQPTLRIALKAWLPDIEEAEWGNEVFDLIYALDSDDDYLDHLKRADIALPNRDLLRLLHRCGFSQLRWAADRCLRSDKLADVQRSLEFCSRVHSPVLAAPMFALASTTGSSAHIEAAATAERWLINEGGNSISYLLSNLAFRATRRDVSIRILRAIRDRAGKTLLERGIAAMPTNKRAELEQLVFSDSAIAPDSSPRPSVMNQDNPTTAQASAEPPPPSRPVGRRIITVAPRPAAAPVAVVAEKPAAKTETATTKMVTAESAEVQASTAPAKGKPGRKKKVVETPQGIIKVLPPVTNPDGDRVPEEEVRQFLSILQGCKLPKLGEKDEGLSKAKDQAWEFSPESASALAESLLQSFFASGASEKDRWLIRLLAIFADTQLCEAVKPYLLKETTPYMAAAMESIPALQHAATRDAIWLLHELAHHPILIINRTAQSALYDLADQRNMTLEEMLDQTTPTCGLNAKSTIKLTFGEQSFTFVVANHSEIILTDKKGNRLDTLPDADVGDSVDLFNYATRQYHSANNRIKELVQLQAERLEIAMIDRRSWKAADWRGWFLQHPINRHITRCLIWATIDKAGVIQTPFRPNEDGALVNVLGEPIAPSEDKIVLVHPLDLDDAWRQRWAAHLAERQITQPMEQISRFTATAVLPGLNLGTNRLPSLKAGLLEHYLCRRGYMPAEDGSQQFIRIYDEFDTVAALSYQAATNSKGESVEKIIAQEFYSLKAYDKALETGVKCEKLPQNRIPAIVFSETQRDAKKLIEKNASSR